MSFFSQLFGAGVPHISAREASARLNNGAAPFLLDVRQPEEFSAGHIAGARLIPLGELSAHLRELPAEREIICVCRSGSRSSHATRILRDAGFTATNLAGGMNAWLREGLPVQRGPVR